MRDLTGYQWHPFGPPQPTPPPPIPRRRVGWLITLAVVTVSLAVPLITARVEVHRLQQVELAHITQAHAQRQRIDTLCEITSGQSQILAMNLPGTIYDWSPPIGELCR